MNEYTHFCLFAGIGGLSLGMSRGHARIGMAQANLRCIGGIDSDPQAVKDFERITGAKGTVMDLFDEQGYADFHGHPPPHGWREATADDLRRAAGGEFPDILTMSPPCKGFSGLLNARNAASAKYQALNELVFSGLILAMDAWGDDPPSLILLENVPRIQGRGRVFLDCVTGILHAFGYSTAETVHDCGELGGLGQQRKRFLLVARHREKVPPFLYEPPKRRMLTVGQVFGSLPMPDNGHPMHELPSLQMRTWLRLALIEAGKDWRCLQSLAVRDGVLADYGLLSVKMGRFANKMRVEPWDGHAHCVTGADRVGSGAMSVADPRFDKEWGDYHAYRIAPWDKHAETVTSKAAPGSGAFSVADPRLECDVSDRHGRRHCNVYRIVRWDETATAVTATATGNSKPNIADPRFPWEPRAWKGGGHYGVVPWNQVAGAVIGSARHDNAYVNVADPRMPKPTEQCKPVIIALDNTWHRPMTTLELAALQGFDLQDLVLDGQSHARWRMAIGNAVPPPAAQAIGTEMARTLLARDMGSTFALANTPIWVRRIAIGLSLNN